MLLGLAALVLVDKAAHGEDARRNGARGDHSAPIDLHSAAGRFRIRLAGLAREERLNHLHGFALSLATADGQPVGGASIVLRGKQRTALNPLPTLPRVRPGPRPGAYRVEGLRFHVSGAWLLEIAIEFEQSRDHVAFDIDVK
ncbi:MAG: hypothetical protein HY056_05200 [Proteobacteria bacterium]|nr:hypothetical protein [Pseudomonadota bacterium]